MRQQQYEAYAASLEPLTDAELVERIATEIEAVSRNEADGDAKQACREETERRGKPDLYADGLALANRRRDEARRINQENRS